MRLTLPTRDQSAREELPGQLYIGFVDSLLVEVRSLFFACTASVTAALVAAIASRSVSLWACAGLMLGLSFVRMHFQRTGDKLLVEIARRLSAIIDPHDLVARWGGDEFVILHRHAPGQSETPAVAKRIIGEINRAVVIDGSEVIVGASIGSASAPDDGISPDALLSKADIALYAAKADGRRVWRRSNQRWTPKSKSAP